MAKLYFHYSSMNAGKSTALLQAHHNYGERGMKTLLLCPCMDDRYGVGVIRSRIGIQQRATPFQKGDNLLECIREKTKGDKIACVLVDEAQFLTQNQVSELCRVVDELGIPVLAFGLRTDFLGEPFEGSRYLLSWADEIKEIKTICHCGKKAIMNARINDLGIMETEGEQIEIGGNDRYISLCRACFAAGRTGIN